MSKKQFTFIKDTVAPNIKTPIVFNNETMSIGEVLDKLNELSDENEQLKIFLKALNEELSLANRDNDTLEEENEQLKKECKIAIDEMVTDYKKLEKENEMLRILLKDIYVNDELRKLAEKYGVENE